MFLHPYRRSRQVLLWQYCRGVREAETLPEEPITTVSPRSSDLTWFAKGPVLDFRLSDCRGHDLLIALDSYRTVGQG